MLVYNLVYRFMHKPVRPFRFAMMLLSLKLAKLLLHPVLVRHRYIRQKTVSLTVVLRYMYAA